MPFAVPFAEILGVATGAVEVVAAEDWACFGLRRSGESLCLRIEGPRRYGAAIQSGVEKCC